VTEALAEYDANSVQASIFTIRGEKVILDADLARMYGVTTKVLNQAAKRNADKFPDDFMFLLSKDETEKVRRSRSQSVTLKRGLNIKYLPRVFTEHGALMAATVLNSPKAVQMSVFIVRAFVGMRTTLTNTRELARKLAGLEREVKARLDTHDAAIVDILRRIMDMIDPPECPDPTRKQIGFSVKEKRAKYTAQARSPRKSVGKRSKIAISSQ
jgi:hypothetical protein